MGVVTTIALGVASAGLSFAQASQLAKDNREANRLAAADMAKLKERANIKFTDKLSLNTDLYEQQYEQNLQLNTDLVNAARESGPREVAALAGKIGASQTAANEAIRLSQTNRLQEIETLQMAEGSEINQQVLAMETAQLQDKTARDAQTRQGVASATMSGVNALVNTATTLAANTPENPMSKENKAIKNTLDKNGVSFAEYRTNPDKYKNLFTNADGSPITDGLMSTGTLPSGSVAVPQAGLNTDGSDVAIQNTLNQQQKQLNFLQKDYNPNLSEMDGMTDDMLRNESIAEMNYNTGPNPNNIMGNNRNSAIQAAGGSLAPPPTVQNPNFNIPGFMPGIQQPQPSYLDFLNKYNTQEFSDVFADVPTYTIK